MSRSGNAYIADQERMAWEYSRAEVEGWMMDSVSLHHAMQALREIALGHPHPHVLAAKIIADIEPDPEKQPGHQYATEAEYQEHFEHAGF